LLESVADISVAVGFCYDDGFPAVADSLLMFFSAGACCFVHLTLQKIWLGFLGPGSHESPYKASIFTVVLVSHTNFRSMPYSYCR
jgi:hypothetical protein